MSTSLFHSMASGLSALLEPIDRIAANPASLHAMLAMLGVLPNASTTTLVDALTSVMDLKDQIDTMASQETPSFDDIAGLLEAAADAFEALRGLELDGVPVGLERVGKNLVNLLVMAFLERTCPVARPAAALLTLLDPVEDQDLEPPLIQNGQLVRNPYSVDKMRLDRLPSLLRDPVAVLREEYANPLLTAADARALADKLFPRLQRLLQALGVTCRYGIDPDDADFLGDSAALMAHALIIYANDPLKGAGAEAGLVLALSAAEQGDLGLVVSPFGALTFQRPAGPWMIDAGLSAGINVVAWGRHGMTLLADAGAVEAQGHLTATLAAPEGQPAYVIGKPDGTRLELSGARLGVEASLNDAHPLLGLSADVTGAKLVIAGGDGDGFLASILPADGLQANLDLGLTWSSDTGLTLRGSAGLDATLPIGLSLGPVTLSTLHLGLHAADAQVVAKATVGLLASIGPVTAVVDGVGIDATIGFPASGGNLGPANLALGFKGPSGIGLSVDAQGVLSGGGFLSHDAAQGTYAGVMQLSLHDVLTLTAFGLVSTRMADGSKGYSLVIFITAEDFRPIPLGMGFSLQGIGGMVGVHRTFDVNVLRAGMQNDTLKSLLFPQNAVANAPAILAALASAFPARRGSYLLGLLVRIGWGTPTLIQFDLALILEFGARHRLLALGRISALLPSRSNDLVRLNLNAVGVIDFDAGNVAVDALLIDSRLAHKFALTGAAALRASWGSGPGFVLSVGGFNPRFAPPASVPSLDRVAIALSSGSNPRLTCEAYFAITSNTLQFGARAQLYAEAYGFSLHGDVGFDVLLSRAPLHFLADFHASVQLKRGSRNLFKVAVEGALEGPRPLRLSGKASFEIFWCDFSVRFDMTLVKGEPPPLPPAVDVKNELLLALAAASSWRTIAPAYAAHGVALRKLPSGSTLVVDPLGRLAVTQDVVPLNTARDIDLFGGAPVAGDRRFALSAAVNGLPLAPTQTLQAPFAPAQFFDMSDDDKIASPSFESHDAGVVVGSEAVVFDAEQLAATPLEYESIVIDELAPVGVPQPVPDVPPTRYTLQAVQLERHSASGSAARAPLRRVGRSRFHTEAEPAVRLARTGWDVRPLDDAPAAVVDPSATTWSACHAAAALLNRGGARYQLVPTLLDA